MIKLIGRSIAIALTLSLGLLHTSGSVRAMSTQERVDTVAVHIPRSITSYKNAKNLDFSSDGQSGNRTGGGSRSDCLSLDPPLTMLAPSNNNGMTVSSRPTLWAYVPYTSTQVPRGEFVLQNEQREDIMRLSFTLPKTSGLVSVTVPESEAPLLVGELYLWYFNLYCGTEQNTPIYTQGWIQRVDLDYKDPSDLSDLRLDEYYAHEGIWFDALHELALLRRDRPADPELLYDWDRLMNAPAIVLELPDFEFAGVVELQTVGCIARLRDNTHCVDK